MEETNINYLGEGTCGAVFSPDRLYRYSLWRRWGFGRPPNPTTVKDVLDSDLCCFIGLNPSTADEVDNDPTVRRCIDFSKRWGYAGMVMLNLFAWRATDSKVMKLMPHPIGPLNDAAIKYVTSRCGRTVCCWGVHGAWLDRGAAVLAMLDPPQGRLFHLGQTKAYHPKHPLYLAANTEPDPVWF